MTRKGIRFYGFLSLSISSTIGNNGFCLFSSSKKANAAVSIWVEFPVEGPSGRYLSFTSLNRRKAFDCYIESGAFFFFFSP